MNTLWTQKALRWRNVAICFMISIPWSIKSQRSHSQAWAQRPRILFLRYTFRTFPPLRMEFYYPLVAGILGERGPFPLFPFFSLLFYVLNFYFDNPYPSTHSHPQNEHPRLSNLSGLTHEDIKPVPLCIFWCGVSGFSSFFKWPNDSLTQFAFQPKGIFWMSLWHKSQSKNDGGLQ